MTTIYTKQLACVRHDAASVCVSAHLKREVVEAGDGALELGEGHESVVELYLMNHPLQWVELEPDEAIAIGEALVKAGKEAKSE